jgi:hypothetical protein
MSESLEDELEGQGEEEGCFDREECPRTDLEQYNTLKYILEYESYLYRDARLTGERAMSDDLSEVQK